MPRQHLLGVPPAERAGLLPEDVIIEVDRVSMEGKSLQDVVTAVRGPKGTQVTLTIGRPGTIEPVTLTITREDITIPSVESRIIAGTGGKVGYIAANNRPLLLQRGPRDWLVKPDWADAEGIQSFAGQPLSFKADIPS